MKLSVCYNGVFDIKNISSIRYDELGVFFDKNNPIINLGKVSHLNKGLTTDGENVLMEIKTLDTSEGKILNELINSGVNVYSIMEKIENVYKFSIGSIPDGWKILPGTIYLRRKKLERILK